MAPPPQKRVRTGCLKCRARRRKCTEEKPRCQRCVAGGFECQYGTRLSFLQKNSFTVAPASPGEGSPSYRKVQFVSDAASNSEPESSGANLNASPLSSIQPPASSPSLQLEARQTLSPAESGTSMPTPATETSKPEAAVDTLHPFQPDRKTENPPRRFSGDAGLTVISPRNQQSPKEDYEIALDVLLSLGNTVTGNEIGSGSNTMRKAPSDEAPAESGIRRKEGTRPEPEPESLRAERLHGQNLIERHEVRLLMHYRYQVAPWLDICDLSQPLGVSVLCLASQDPSIRRSILALSAATLPNPSNDFRRPQAEVDVLSKLCQSHPNISSADNPASELVCAVFAKTRDQFQDQDSGEKRQAWPDHDLVQLMTSIAGATATAPFIIAACYLALRLELGSALIDETSLSIPVHFLKNLSSGWGVSDLATRVFSCASELLILCARAVNLAAGEVSINSLGQQDTVVTAWTSLAEDLTSWHSRRPQECKPVAEVDGSEEAFPVVLFTSGAGVLGNQLYHTAMLLLLQNRPRTVKLGTGTHARPSATMSALWHAQRICGIALSNDQRECWDPSLVSSFVVAAKTMTHEGQHQVVLGGLDKIAALTGWSMTHHKGVLLDAWGHERDIVMTNG